MIISHLERQKRKQGEKLDLEGSRVCWEAQQLRGRLNFLVPFHLHPGQPSPFCPPSNCLLLTNLPQHLCYCDLTVASSEFQAPALLCIRDQVLPLEAVTPRRQRSIPYHVHWPPDDAFRKRWLNE